MGALLRLLRRLFINTLGWLGLHLLLRKVLHTLLPQISTSSSASENSDGTRDVEDENVKAKIFTKLRAQGPSYLVSTIHAIAQTVRGIDHIFRMFRAPIPLKLYHPDNILYPEHRATYLATVTPLINKFLRISDDVQLSNLYFTSYLISDLMFVLSQYPSLGGVDVLAHHIVFLFCALVGAYFKINIFMYTWLILGEASTPFLNLRWLILTLTKTSKSRHSTDSSSLSSVTLHIVQVIFALLFFVTRICVYSLGLLYQLEIVTRFPSHIPKWPVYSTLAFVVAGFVLNLSWFTKIVAKFLRPKPRTPSLNKSIEKDKSLVSDDRSSVRMKSS